jgi:hypothetical protein
VPLLAAAFYNTKIWRWREHHLIYTAVIPLYFLHDYYTVRAYSVAEPEPGPEPQGEASFDTSESSVAN